MADALIEALNEVPGYESRQYRARHDQALLVTLPSMKCRDMNPGNPVSSHTRRTASAPQ